MKAFEPFTLYPILCIYFFNSITSYIHVIAKHMLSLSIPFLSDLETQSNKSSRSTCLCEPTNIDTWCCDAFRCSLQPCCPQRRPLCRGYTYTHAMLGPLLVSHIITTHFLYDLLQIMCGPHSTRTENLMLAPILSLYKNIARCINQVITQKQSWLSL